MPSNRRYPPYFYRYQTIPELFNYISFERVVEKTKQYFKVIDKLEDTELTAITTLINLTFGLLGTEGYLTNTITRWQYKESIPQIEQYMSRILYDSTKEYWMKNKVFNASMDWDSLNKLLSKEVSRGSRNTNAQARHWGVVGNTDTTTTNETKQSGGTTSDTKNAVLEGAGNPIDDGWERENKYFEGGNKSDTTNTRDLTDNSEGANNIDAQREGDDLSQSVREHTSTESIQQVKFEYLDKYYKYVDANKFAMEVYFSDFLLSLIWPLQNPETSEFPWVWTWSNRTLVR